MISLVENLLCTYAFYGLIRREADPTNYGTPAVITDILNSKNHVINRLSVVISCIIINTVIHAVAYFQLPASRALTGLAMWRSRAKVLATRRPPCILYLLCLVPALSCIFMIKGILKHNFLLRIFLQNE